MRPRRYPRPNYQKQLSKDFISKLKKAKSFLLVVDPRYRAHPSGLRPDLKIPNLYKWGLEAENLGFEYRKRVLEQINPKKYEVKLLSDIHTKKEIELLKKLGAKCKITKYKSEVDNTGALLIFRSDAMRQELKWIVSEYMKAKKPVCVIDRFNVKRYPRP